MAEGSTALLRRAHFSGNEAPFGSAILVRDAGTSVKVEDSIIANTSTHGVGVVYDSTGDPFAVELDTVRFLSHARPAIYSTSEVLAQNCDGLEPADVVNASVGSCATTGAYCMPQAR